MIGASLKMQWKEDEMKKKLGIILVACLSFALCAVLSACGAPDKSLYVGTWELQDSNSETFDADTLDLMQTLDVKVTLSLSDDNTGTLNYLGNDPHSATWKISSNSEGEVSIDGATNKLTLENGVLTMTSEDGTFMSFSKVSDDPMAAAANVPAASDSAASASAESASSESASAASASAESASSEEAADADENGQDDEAVDADEGGDEEVIYYEDETSDGEVDEWAGDDAEVYDDSEYQEDGEEA